MRAAVEAVEAEHGAVGALVNNAGYSQSGALETLPMERLRAQFETNVFGLVRMCQLVLPGMRAAGRGRIVNLSSMGGKLVFPGGGAYHATKYAVEALSDALRFEVSGFGVRVVDHRAGPDHDQLRRDGRRLARPRRRRRRRPADDPYAGLQRRRRRRDDRRLRGPDEAPRRRARDRRPGDRAGDPSRNPKPRYKVTASARLALGQRGLLTDRAWDAVMRSQFPSPGYGGRARDSGPPIDSRR